MRSLRRLTTAWVIVGALSATMACSKGSDTVQAGASAKASLASLDIIDSDALVRSDGTTEFATASTGRSLARNDGVRTNGTGFAEVAYFDGSLVRLDHDSAFSVVELSNADQARVIRGNLESGASWQRVEKLGEKDSYEVNTPVGNASVRGTAFAIDCKQADRCTFSVVEGTVAVRTYDKADVLVKAGETLTVVKDEPPPQPRKVALDELRAEPWIAKNLARDATRGRGIPNREPEDSTTTSAEGEGHYDDDGQAYSFISRMRPCPNGAEVTNVHFATVGGLPDGADSGNRPPEGTLLTKVGPHVFEWYEPGTRERFDAMSGLYVEGSCDGSNPNPEGPNHQDPSLGFPPSPDGLFTDGRRDDATQLWTWTIDLEASRCAVGGRPVNLRRVFWYSDPNDESPSGPPDDPAAIVRSLPYTAAPGSNLYTATLDVATYEEGLSSEGPGGSYLSEMAVGDCDYSGPEWKPTKTPDGRPIDPDTGGVDPREPTVTTATTMAPIPFPSTPVGQS